MIEHLNSGDAFVVGILLGAAVMWALMVAWYDWREDKRREITLPSPDREHRL